VSSDRSARTTAALGVATGVAFAVLVVLGLAVAPPDALQGDAQRIMYVHVPSAWLAYLAFAITAIASVLYLLPRTRAGRWDHLAGASAEVGVVFTGLTLATGSIWGRPIWGTWWEWDARLTTTAVLFFLYLGYLAVRRIGGTQQARGVRSAVVALVAFADVPIVHFSVTWWQTLHQEATVFNRDLDVRITGMMAFALVWGVVAFTMLYVLLVRLRARLAALEDGLEERELEQAIRDRVGAAAPSMAGATQ
jgi:heme exporter protein C